MLFRKRSRKAAPIIHADDHDLESVVDRPGVVVVDFWAPWCGPCRMMAPILDDIALEYAERGVTVVKVNTDQAPASADRWGIRSIPTLVFFKDGVPHLERAGLVPQPILRREIESLLDP